MTRILAALLLALGALGGCAGQDPPGAPASRDPVGRVVLEMDSLARAKVSLSLAAIGLLQQGGEMRNFLVESFSAEELKALKALEEGKFAQLNHVEGPEGLLVEVLPTPKGEAVRAAWRAAAAR